VIDASGPRLLPGTLDLATRGVVAGGTRRNHEYVTANTDWGDLTEPEQLVLADAQTSGGLLIAAAAGTAAALEEDLTAAGLTWSGVGAIIEGPPGAIRVTGRIS
jgi:selenide,water dikinase